MDSFITAAVTPLFLLFQRIGLSAFGHASSPLIGGTFPILASIWIAFSGIAYGVDPDTIAVDNSQIDFGVIAPNKLNETPKSVAHRFVLKNVSTEAVEIKEVKSSCACMEAKPESLWILPGEEVGLSAAMNLQAKRGKVNATIMVLLSVGKPLLLNLAAFVHGIPASTPAALNARRFAGEGTELDFEILRGASSPIDPDEQVTFRCDLKECSFVVTDRRISKEPDASGVYSCSYRAKCKIGKSTDPILSGTCEALINGSRLITIPIKVETLPPISLRKTKIYAGSGKAGEELIVSLEIIAQSHINVEKILVDDSPVKFILATNRPDTVLLSFPVIARGSGIFTRRGRVIVEGDGNDGGLRFSIFGSALDD